MFMLVITSRDSGASGSTYSVMQRYVFIGSNLLGSEQCRFGPESFVLSGASTFADRQNQPENQKHCQVSALLLCSL